MNRRFTLDGSDALEQHLSEVCNLVADGIRSFVPLSKLQGIALAGGYGRGEGGVLRSDDGDHPYNDLEFFVFIQGSLWKNEKQYQPLLIELGERLTPIAGIEVEFKIISASSFRRAKPSMFYYDLIMGHRWLVGDDGLLKDCQHHQDSSRIPLHEVTRLLFNRCSGLLFAKSRLQQTHFSTADADFVYRNIAKAQLALGDADLAAKGKYHWSCLERHQRLEAEDAIRYHHAKGVEFKLHPHRSLYSKKELQILHDEISALAESCFLRIESQRLSKVFSSAKEYAASKINKCPEQPIWKNILHHVRLRQLKRITRHPREALLHQLCEGLWSTGQVNITEYLKLWHRFN